MIASPSRTGPAGAGRKPRDLKATIAAIMAAARHEFLMRGFEGARMEHIARRAKVSKQLVYLYFHGKRELYSEIMKEIAREFYVRLSPLEYEVLPPLEAIRLYVAAVYDCYVASPAAGAFTHDESLHDGEHLSVPNDVRDMQASLRDRIAATLLRGQNEKVLNDRFDATDLEFLTMTIASASVTSRHMFERYIGMEMNRGPGEMREMAIAFIMSALRA